MESVLQYINRLNRNLESIIAVRPLVSLVHLPGEFVLICFFFCWLTQVGNEFSSVEALWSQFENVMGAEEGQQQQQQTQQQQQQGLDNRGDGEEGEEEEEDNVDVKQEDEYETR